MSRLVRGVRAAWWRLRARLHRRLLTLSYPGFACAPSATIDPTAVIRATDGGRIEIGENCEIGANAMIVAEGGRITIGPGSYVGVGAVIIARESIDVGPDALLSQYVTIRDHDHRFDDPVRPYGSQGFLIDAVTLGANVWLGAKVTVTRGVAIGDACVVGANAVVTRDLPARSLALGVPARVTRML